MTAATFSTWFLGKDKPNTAVKPERDMRIDIIRGLALLMIFINHTPGNAFSVLTLANFVLNDAAEVFVLLAGYSSMMAYHRGFEGRSLLAAARPILLRARTLYLVQLGLTAIMLVLALWLARQTGETAFLTHFGIGGDGLPATGALIGAPLLLFQLSYVDILPLYIVLLLATPLLIAGIRRSPALVLAASVGLYLVTLHTGLNLPMGSADEWFFNPFAWQLIFVIGLVAGHATLTGVRLPRSTVLVAASVAILLFAVSQKAPWSGLDLGGPLPVALPFDLNYGAKTYVAPGRLLSLLALAYLTALWLPRSAAFLRGRAGLSLEQAGRNSLPVFVVGTVLSLLAMAVIWTAEGHIVAVLLVTVAGGAALLATPMLASVPIPRPVLRPLASLSRQRA